MATEDQKKKLQQLCGDYQVLRHEMINKKIEMISYANELGLSEHLALQMDEPSISQR
jgi:hypothetical protein